MAIAFNGGEGLEATLKELSKKLSKPGALRVGFLENASYPDGTPVATVAAVQEFGAPAKGIPPRPFFRVMLAEKSPGWGKALAAILKADDYNTGKALGQMGMGIQGQLQQSIVDFSGVPLAPATVARKGSEKQLVDTGHMLSSVDFEVSE